MANYIATIDDEIAKLRSRLNDLEATKRVLSTLQEPVVEARKKARGPIEGMLAIKQKRKSRAATNLDKVRVAIVDLLADRQPQMSRFVINALAHLKVADSTIWKALKMLKDEGVLDWDTEARTYKLKPEPGNETQAEQRVAS
jgi:hypothetical protein